MRILLMLALLLLPMTLITAQAAPAADARAEVEILQEGESRVFKVKRGGSFPMQELMRSYAQTTGKVFMFETHKIQFEVTLMGGEGDNEFSGHQFDLLVQNALESRQMAMYECMPNVLAVIPEIEVATVAKHLTIEQLETANPSMWARLLYAPKHADPNAMRGAMQNLISRSGGTIMPVPGSGLILVERVDRLRELLTLARELDDIPEVTLVAYDAPEGVKPEAAAQALQQLFGGGPAHRPTRFAGVSGTRRVLGYATAEVHAQVADALAKMK